MHQVSRAFGLAAAVLTLVVLFGCPPPCPVAVVVAPPTAALVVGETIQLAASSTDPQDTSFAWSTGDPSVANVTAEGVVTGVSVGTATVLATGAHSGASGAAAITVADDGEGEFNTSLPTDPAQAPPVLEWTSSLDECVCTLECPGIAAGVTREQGVPYHRLQLEHAVPTADSGKAEIPFLVLHFAVPLDAETHDPANWHVEVTADYEASYQYIRPYPAQLPVWLEEWGGKGAGKQVEPEEEEPSWPEFVLDEVFYASREAYPGYYHEAEVFQIGNLSMVRVRLFPAQYYPAQRRLALAQRMHVKVSFDSPNGLMAPVILGDYTGMQAPGDEEWMTDFPINGEIITPITVSELATALAPIDPQGIHDDPFQLLIITRDDLLDQARRLARWRQDTGTRVWLKSYGEDAVPDADTIRDYIMDLDEDNLVPDLLVVGLPAMSAILLFGDVEIIPTCQGMNNRAQATPTSPTESVLTVGTDLYYSTIRGDDDAPDVAVGRISVDAWTEAKAVVDKIIRYEDRAPLARPNHVSIYSYFQESPGHYATLDGDVTFTVGSPNVVGDGTRFTEQIDTSNYRDYIRIEGGYDDYEDWARVGSVVSDTELLLAHSFLGPSNVTGTAEVGDLDGEDDWVFVKGAERVRHFMLERGVTARFGYNRSRGPTPVAGYEGAALAPDLLAYTWDADASLIQSYWGSGLDGIVLHCDHGYRGGWGHPPFASGDLVAMADPETAYYPILIGMNCSSGWFDNESDTRRFGDGTFGPHTDTTVGYESFCEMALRHEDGGAVAAIGATRGSTSRYNDKLIDGLFGAFYRDYEEGTLLTRPPMPTYYRLGPAFLWAKFHQEGCLTRATSKLYNMEIYNLLGDPMMVLRLPEPPD